MFSCIFLVVPAIVALGFVGWWKFTGKSAEDAIKFFIFLRYQWLLALLLFFFPLLADSPLLQKYLGNLLVPERWWDVSLITFFAILAAIPIILASELTISYGRPRFGVDSPHDLYFFANRYYHILTGRSEAPLGGQPRRIGIIRLLRFVLGVVLTLPIVARVAMSLSQSVSVWLLLLAAIIGYAGGAWFIRLALFLRNCLVRKAPVVDITYLWLDWPLWPLLNGREQLWLEQKPPSAVRTPKRQPHAMAGIKPEIVNAQGSQRICFNWYPGHLSALFLLVVYFVVYTFVINRCGPSAPRYGVVPPLGFVLLFMGLWYWILPAAAFWFDRWRLPVPLMLLACWTLSSYVLSEQDHYYWVKPLSPSAPSAGATSSDRSEQKDDSSVRQPLTANAALEAWLSQERKSKPGVIVIVNAAGGGIVASAWTAEVLTTLEAALQEKFTDALWAISSVSGGSVGTFYYMQQFPRPASGSAPMLDRIRHAARTSSLSATAWGSVGPDFWRFAGGLLHIRNDRASALELAWKLAWAGDSSALSSTSWPTLESWRRSVRVGRFPIVFFNSTAVESGSPYLFTPIDVHLPASTSSNLSSQALKESKAATAAPQVAMTGQLPENLFAGFGNFVEDYRKYDVECVTAARLSATFPWVTPVARAATAANRSPIDPRIHMADGGYFDNFGIATLVELLSATYPKLKEHGVKTIVLIDISPWSRGAAKQAAAREEIYGPLAIQVFGPFSTLYNARDTSQSGRAASEIRLLQEGLKERGLTLEHVPVYMDKFLQENVDFDVPLSWHLDQKEQRVIEAAAESLQALLNPKPPSVTPSAGLPAVAPSAGVGAVQPKVNDPELEEQWQRVRGLLGDD